MQAIRMIGVVPLLVLLWACAGPNATVKRNAAADLSGQNIPTCSEDPDAHSSGDSANCTSFSRSYSSDDLHRTGATTAGAALRLLDPAITVH